ncbi:hypothetical protein [Pseudoalteromonas sp. MMG005]|uniref:hypothetical protein n=1 Tax=Pseudoalteromonas sp. MMG005 TaxID=2822682 RepID=UPI001B39E105|nr:hypothetical protein [Pseudoalteromonas sp. MMG005]
MNMKKDFVLKKQSKSRLKLKILTIGLLNLGVAYAQEPMCSASFQLVNYSPQKCYSEFSESDCTDVCAAADPEYSPQCFKSLDLPCDVISGLHSTGKGFQSRDDYSWFHVSDLLTYPELISELHIFQQELFDELYGEFVNKPKYFGFSPASDEFRRVNFRLDVLTKLDSLASPLRFAGLYRRYSLGLLLEEQLNRAIIDIKFNIDKYPYFDTAQRQSLKAEIDSVLTVKLRYWDLLKRYTPEQISSSRVGHLNRRVRTLSRLINVLPLALQDKMLEKSQLLTPHINIELKKCDTGICYTKITAPEAMPFYPEFDYRLLKFEQVLTALNNEASALTNIYNDNYQVIEPRLLRQPDFAGFVSSKLVDYKALRSQANLERLATAIDIAYLSKNQTGKAVLAALTERSDVTDNMGVTSLSAFGTQPILLCQEFRKINPEMAAIQDEGFTLATEARSLLSLMIRDGYTAELLTQLEAIIARLNQLAARSQVISNVEMFDKDRLVTIDWDLFEASALTHSREVIELEYLEYNGMFWTPNMSRTLSEIFPSIYHAGTMSGSLLPSGVTANSQLNNLQITFSQSAFHACSANNATINAVVKVTDGQGTVSRQVLTANFDQL